MTMCELRMLEVVLVSRPLMELCANQAVLNADHPKLAERYSLEKRSTDEQLVAMGHDAAAEPDARGPAAGG